MPPLRLAAALVAALLADLLAAPPALAWPDKPVTIVVPFTAGGSTDNVARITAEWLGKQLKQPVNVENRAGASGSIAAEYVAGAPPDGHTLFMVSLAQMSILPHMQKVRYDPFTSFAPIGVLSTSAFALAVHPEFPAKNLAELVAYAKANPGKISYGSAGNGSATHLTTSVFAHRAGITMTHVPYKGIANAIGDLTGGHLPMVFGSVSEILRPYKAGKVRVLGVSSPTRLSQMAEVPTVAESGYPGYVAMTWNGLVVQSGASKALVAQIAEAVKPACRDTAFTARFKAIDAEAWCSTPEEFAQLLRDDWKRWGEAVKVSGAKVE